MRRADPLWVWHAPHGFQEAQVAKKLYVGNLPYGITSSDLERVFQAHGTVESAQVITDRDTGRSKGFGFVEMRDSMEAEEAIQALNGQDFNGRPLTVNEARPREDRGGGRREFGGSRAKSGFSGGNRW
jgi:cold-inducible RNA-binding protein